MSLWRHVRAIGLLPGTGTVVIPVATLLVTRSVSVGWGLPGAAAVLPVLAGVLLLAFGLVLLYRTIRLFAGPGQGTLAPWDPPRRLVVEGPYRHVRNPMISGVLFTLAGEAVLLGSPPLAAWLALFFAINAAYFPLVEEPGLERRFGDDYRLYRRNVPRWIPRRTPWAVPR
jgi:protein-S-isoprenylcysteine O-methyltransferase Ste14